MWFAAAALVASAIGVMGGFYIERCLLAYSVAIPDRLQRIEARREPFELRRLGTVLSLVAPNAIVFQTQDPYDPSRTIRLNVAIHDAAAYATLHVGAKISLFVRREAGALYSVSVSPYKPFHS